jgi:hypothetical protein
MGFVVSFLFILTGLAIITFLNQQPYEPRERDYSYAGSCYAFSIWIGIGVLSLIDQAIKKLKLKNFMAIGSVTLFATLLVPGLMAQQNWDDHDRSGKYSARDYAFNYMKSCDKDAILFTNGDNDTFPLWYSQEVEGVRTDVRIVNLELASGSWYIDQLYNKEYNSDPLPFSLTKEQYQPGSNDEIAYYDFGIKGNIELADLIEFIRSDDPRTFMTTQGGQKVKVFPTRNVKITVDKEAVLKYGIVPSYFKDKIADSVCWTIKKNYLTKNDIMNLDIIASNKWKRPLYYTAIASVKDYFDVDKYCMVEGWVYKFMPVKADSQDYYPSIGGIDALNSYDILMHKSAWGNVNDPRVYIDPETRNSALRPKMNMLRISQSLIRLGEKKKALDIMDLFFKNFPLQQYSVDMDDVYFTDLYYKTGQFDKANKLVENISKIYSENLEYYYSFSGNFIDAYKEDIQYALEMIHNLQVMASRNNQDKLSKQMENLFNLEASKFKQ